MLSRHGNRTRLLKNGKLKIVLFLQIKSRRILKYFVGVFNNIIFPLAIFGYEMIIANEARSAELASNHVIWNDW